MAFYRVKFFGHLLDNEIFDTGWHVSRATGDVTTVATTALDAFTLMWSGTNTPAGNIEGMVNTGIGVDGVEVDELDGSGKNVEQHIISASLTGTSAEEPLPYQVSVKVSFRTADPIKGGTGGFYLPPFTVAQCASSRLDPTDQTAVKNGALAAARHMQSNGCPLVVWHKAINTASTVTDVDVGDVFDVQSRRRNQLVEVRVRTAL